MVTKKILMACLAVALGAGIWFWRQLPPASITAPAKKAVYYCPMHPDYTSDRLEKCPICGMNLVLRADGSSAAAVESQKSVEGYVTVHIDPARQKWMGLQTMAIKRQHGVKTIWAPGRVTTNHDLYMLQDEYVQAYTSFVNVFRQAKRVAHLRRSWETHRDLQLKLHAAENKLLGLGFGPGQIEQLQEYNWRTPWDQPGVMFLKDDFEYWVQAQIFESDLGYVEVGQNVQVEIPSYKEKTAGILRSVGGLVDPQTRTANALIELHDYRGELKGNMLVKVSISVDMGEVLLAPKQAVMDLGSRKVLFVETEPGHFEPQQVRTGWETEDGLEITSGLKEGERIVVSGNFLLDSESRIQAVFAKRQSGSPSAGGHSHE